MPRGRSTLIKKTHVGVYGAFILERFQTNVFICAYTVVSAFHASKNPTRVFGLIPACSLEPVLVSQYQEGAREMSLAASAYTSIKARQRS